jgi:P27 family predicted phage terminase small subunit
LSKFFFITKIYVVALYAKEFHIMKGRKRKPVELKKLAGNPGGRPLEKELDFKKFKDIPAPPKELGPIAKTEWTRVTNAMVNAGIIKETDWVVLAVYCTLYEQYRGLTDDHELMSVTAREGTPCISPKLKASLGVVEKMLKCMVELGLTPSARTKLSGQIDAPNKKSKKEEFNDFLDEKAV